MRYKAQSQQARRQDTGKIRELKKKIARIKTLQAAK